MTTKKSSPSGKSLARGTAIVGSLTAMSRVLGFVRDLLFARILGAGLSADIFLVAFRIPNTMRAFFAEGALSSAFIPVLAEEMQKEQKGAVDFYRKAIGAMLCIVLLCILIMFIFSEEVVLLFAGGFARDSATIHETAALLRIMLPYLPSIMIVVLINGLLTTLHKYGAGSIAQILVNLCLISGALAAAFWEPNDRGRVLAWSVFIAAMIQYGALFPLSQKVGFPPLPSWPRWDAALGKMFWLMIPAILGAAVYQCTILLNTVLASFLRVGSISWLFYADRIAQLPIGIFTVALSSVLLPHLARTHADGSREETIQRLSEAVRYSIFFLLPISIGISLTAEPVIGLLFERGKFSAADSWESAKALRWYALGLTPLSLYAVISRLFIARKQAIIPACIGIAVLAISLCVSLAMMGPIEPVKDSRLSDIISALQGLLPWSLNLGHEGLAISSAVAAATSLILSLVALSKDERRTVIESILQSLRVIPAALLVGSLCLFLNQFKLPNYLHILIILPVSVAVFVIIAKISKCKEQEETFAVLRRYLSRKEL